MILMISLIGFLIFTALFFGLNNIREELQYKNLLLERQNKLLEKQNEILKDRSKL